jgi:hypothetical protein
MSIGVFSMYGKILLAYLFSKYFYFLSADSPISMPAKILLAYYFWRVWRRFCINLTPQNHRNLHIRLKNFGAFSEYYKRLFAYFMTTIKHF